MAIPPFPSTPAATSATTGVNLITGNSTTLATTLGSWVTNGTGTVVLTREDNSNVTHPFGNCSQLKMVTTSTGTGFTVGAKLDVVNPTGFKAGRMYHLICYLAVGSPGISGGLGVNVGPTDGIGLAAPFASPGQYIYSSVWRSETDLYWMPVTTTWTPSVNTPSATIRILRGDASSTTLNTWLLGGLLHGPRLYEDATVPLVTAPDNATTLHSARDTTNIHFSPSLEYGGASIYANHRSVDIYGQVGTGGNQADIYAGSSGFVGLYGPHEDAPGDLVDNGVNVEVGTDFVGFYVSEYDDSTVQLHADWSHGYMMQLRHRGAAKGWSASDDGTTNARIDSFFQWERTVSGALTVGTNVAAHFQTPQKAKIDEVRVHVGTAPTGSSLIVDVNDDGTTIFTTQANRPATAILVQNVTSGSDSTDTTQYFTVPLVIKAGSLYLLSFENSHGSAATAATTVGSATVGPLTMTSRSSTTFNGGLNRTSIWSGVATADYYGTVTIYFGGTVQTGASWSLDEVINVNTTTNDGVVQQAVGTGTSTTPLATLAAFASATNGAFAAHGHAAATATTPGSGWTELSDTTASTPAQALETSYRTTNDTTADATITSAPWGSCAIELASITTDGTSGVPDGGVTVLKNSVITVDVDQVGSTIAGSDMTVFIRGRYIW